MSKALSINYNGKSYQAGYDRAAAKNFARTNFTVQDLLPTGQPFLATIPFVFCAFKKYQPTISEKKVEEIFDALPKNVKPEFLNALVKQYGEALSDLCGDTEADNADEGNAVWENPEESD